MQEIYKRYRPKILKNVAGQSVAVAKLLAMTTNKNTPHTMLFCGPSGVGKTTLARILAKKLGALHSDLAELNCATDRGVDMVRSLKAQIHQAPLHGPCKVWILDEAQQLSTDAQSGLLKITEDTPEHVYFMLCTTHPQKLIPTLRNRCQKIELQAFKESDLISLIERVTEAEGKALSEDVALKIARAADGSARAALVLLEAVIDLPAEQQAEAIEQAEPNKQSIDICRALLDPASTWKDLIPLLKAVTEDPESIRRHILGCASSAMLSGWKTNKGWMQAEKIAALAADVVWCFKDNFFDSGKAGLHHACYYVLQRRKK